MATIGYGKIFLTTYCISTKDTNHDLALLNMLPTFRHPGVKNLD